MAETGHRGPRPTRPQNFQPRRRPFDGPEGIDRQRLAELESEEPLSFAEELDKAAERVRRVGTQIERTDKWLRFGNPWEIARPEIRLEVKFGGRTEPYYDDQGRYRVRWVPDRVVTGTPYDIPVLGYRVNTANFLRLWKAEAPKMWAGRSA